jgi:ABC-type iron transport system FetAB permease component
MNIRSIIRYLLVLVATFFVLNWTFALLNQADSFLNFAGFVLIASWILLVVGTKGFTKLPLKNRKHHNGNTSS